MSSLGKLRYEFEISIPVYPILAAGALAQKRTMWRQPPRLSKERSDAGHVWNGHSCPLPLTLMSMMSISKLPPSRLLSFRAREDA